MAIVGLQSALAVFGICLCCELVQGTFYNFGVRYKVALNLYSGRKNPSWEIDADNPMYDQISWLVNEVPTTPLNDNLGYEGFVVEATNVIGQKAWKTIGRQTNHMVESSLLRSCPSTERLGSQVMNHVYSGIMGQYRKKVLPVSLIGEPVARVPITTLNDNSHMYTKHRLYRKKRQSGFCSTRFEPSNWNFGEVQRRNNCYNYATNRRTNTFAQPGRSSRRMFRRLTPSAVYRASVRDGLIPLRGPRARTGCLIALVIWPGQDYHFLRLDNNGIWSHKNGITAAKNVDDSGIPIRNPRRANLGPYTVFAGWLGVGPRVRIRPVS